jgi:mRNA interferase RelE/StbE
VNPYDVRVTASATKDMRKLSADAQRRLVVAMAALADNPRPVGVRKLVQGTDAYRVRVGEYRILYAIDDAKKVVEISAVKHRREAYRGMD